MFEVPRICRRSPHEGGKVFSPTHRPPLSPHTPGDVPGTHFCYRLSRPQRRSAAGRIEEMKNPNDTIGNRTRDLPTCSAVESCEVAKCVKFDDIFYETGDLGRYIISLFIYSLPAVG